MTTRQYGLETDRSVPPWLSPKEDLNDTSKAMSYLPREGKTYYMWYQRRLMLVSRRLKTEMSSYQQPETLEIRYVGRADMKGKRVLTVRQGYLPSTTGSSANCWKKPEKSSR